MARLVFEISHQTIKRTDCFNVVEKSQNYLDAEFKFITSDWDGVSKTACFVHEDGTKVNAVLVDDMCIVPWEVLANKGLLYVSVFGGDLITVDRAKVRIEKSGMVDGVAPQPPTPSEYAQILDIANIAKSKATNAEAIAEQLMEDADAGRFDGKDGKDGKDGAPGKDGLPGADGHDYVLTSTDKEQIATLAGQKLQPTITELSDAIAQEKQDLSAVADHVDNLETKHDSEVEELKAENAELKNKVAKQERDIFLVKETTKKLAWDIEQREEIGHAPTLKGDLWGNLDEIHGKTEQDNYHMGLAENVTTVTDCAEAPIRELVMEGKTEQNQYGGYQLLEGFAFIGLNTVATQIDTYSVSGNRKGEVPTGTTFFGWYDNAIDVLENGKTYTFSASMKANESGKFYIGCEGVHSEYFEYEVSKEKNISVTFTADATHKTLILYFVGNYTSNAKFEVISIMLEAGSVAHDWEPFVGNIPSPSLQYPQEIQSVKRIDIKVCGKNLCDTLVVGKAWNNANNTARAIIYAKVQKGKTYTISVNDISGIDASPFCVLKKNIEDSTTILSYKNPTESRPTVITPVEDGWVGVQCNKTNITESDVRKVGIQIEVGSVATPFEPYTEQTVTINPPIPLNKIGEYEDICDVEKGLWRYRNSIEDITTTVYSSSVSSGGLEWSGNFSKNVAPPNISDFEKVVSDKYCVVKGRTTYSSIGDAGWAGKYPIISVANATTRAYRLYAPRGTYEFKFVSPMEAEQTEPINLADLALLRSLSTYDDTTNIFITDQLGRDVSNHFRFLRKSGSDASDIVAPTPVYPSDVEGVEEFHIEKHGKNLIKPVNQIGYTTYGITVSYKGDGVWHFEGTATAQYSYRFNSRDLNYGVALEEGKKYTLSAYGNISANSYVACSKYGLWEESEKVTQNGGSKTFTARDGYCVAYIVVVNGTSINTDIKLMLEQGERSTEYEPYREPVGRVIKPPRKTNKIDTFSDVCNVVNGTWSYKIDSLDLPIAGNYNYGTWGTFGAYYTAINPVDCEIFEVACDFLNGKNVSPGTIYNGTSNGICINSNKTQVVFKSEFFRTIDDVREYFSEKRAVLYVRTTPIVEPINESDLEWLRNLELNPGEHLYITDQNGNDVSYMMSFFFNVKEAMS